MKVASHMWRLLLVDDISIFAHLLFTAYEISENSVTIDHYLCVTLVFEQYGKHWKAILFGETFLSSDQSYHLSCFSGRIQNPFSFWKEFLNGVTCKSV